MLEVNMPLVLGDLVVDSRPGPNPISLSSRVWSGLVLSLKSRNGGEPTQVGLHENTEISRTISLFWGKSILEGQRVLN